MTQISSDTVLVMKITTVLGLSAITYSVLHQNVNFMYFSRDLDYICRVWHLAIPVVEFHVQGYKIKLETP